LCKRSFGTTCSHGRVTRVISPMRWALPKSSLGRSSLCSREEPATKRKGMHPRERFWKRMLPSSDNPSKTDYVRQTFSKCMCSDLVSLFGNGRLTDYDYHDPSKKNVRQPSISKTTVNQSSATCLPFLDNLHFEVSLWRTKKSHFRPSDETSMKTSMRTQ